MSKSHNSDSYVQPEENGQLQSEFHLTGSQAKTAFALRHNAEEMCKRAGVAAVGFLTLTVGECWGPAEDGKDAPFIVVKDASEASRRFNNLNRRLLDEIFEEWIAVTERHRSEGIHFHLLGVVRGKPDIRTGFNFGALKSGGFTNACPELRALWAKLNDRLPRYGFGRAQLTPVEKTGEAVASYVSKYVEKHLFNRLQDDRGKRLVRYGGFARHLKANDFGWATEGSRQWRLKAQAVAHFAAAKTEPEECNEVLGPRWALRVTEMFPALDVTVDDCLPWLRDLWGRAEYLHGATRAKQSSEFWDALCEWHSIALAEMQRPPPIEVQQLFWERGTLCRIAA